jgi:capsular polysaccharide biosynthesis protein/Mrp family chromosome partitioning ATPase
VELSYLFSVLRRRWWLPLLGLVVGLVLGQAVGGDTSKQYESRAVLNVSPPVNVSGITIYQSDPDRYVVGQVSVLKSSSLAERVAALLPNRTTDEVSKATTISHEPRTDIVVISVVLDDPKDAERVANGFATTYLADLNGRVAKSSNPLVKSIDDRLATLQASLVDGEKNIQALNEIVTRNSIAIPNLKGTDPEFARLRVETDSTIAKIGQLVADRAINQSRYNEELRNKSELERAASSKVATDIVQLAVVPTQSKPSKSKLTTVGGGLVGLLLGLAVAVMLARLSGRIVDMREVEEALGASVTADIPRAAGLEPLRGLLDKLPAELDESIDQLCVRAESKGSPGRTLTIAVVGTMRPSGVTTLAVAMASRFKELGSSVVLIDADLANSAITRTFAPSALGIPALLANDTVDIRTGKNRPQQDPYVSYGTLHVLGLGARNGRASLPRAQVAEVIEGASREAQIVVIDAGEALDSSSALEICRLVDVVIVAVPVKKQRRQILEEIGGELSGRARSILPVITRPGQATKHGSTEVIESRLVAGA